MAGLLLLLQGCVSAAGASSPTPSGMIRLLSAGIQCNEPGKDPKALWITSAAQYAILQDRLSAHRLRPARPLAQVDFGRSAVLAVFMGQQATAGYGLTLASPHAEIEKGSLRVRLGWREPGKGRASAQLMTSPCVLLEVPRGNFARIQIMDQARQVRIELELAPAGAADPPPLNRSPRPQIPAIRK